jgi:hypothetical protein
MIMIYIVFNLNLLLYYYYDKGPFFRLHLTQQNNMTSLHLAALNGNAALSRLLLARGALADSVALVCYCFNRCVPLSGG